MGADPSSSHRVRQRTENLTHRVPTRWLTAGSLAGLAAGLAAGIAANRSGGPLAMASARAFELVGMLWTNALQMVVYPLIVSLLIVAVGSIGPTRRAGRMGATSFSLFFLFLAAAAVFTMLAAPALIRWMPIEPGTLEALGAAGLDGGVTAARQAPGLADWIVGLIPENPLRAAADGEILPVVVFCLLFGFAIGRLPVERRRPVLGFFDGMAGASMVLVVWILWAIPLAAFAIAFSVSTKVGVQAAGVLGYFVLLVSVLLILFTLAIYPISAVLGRIPLSRFARAVVPAQVVAFWVAARHWLRCRRCSRVLVSGLAYVTPLPASCSRSPSRRSRSIGRSRAPSSSSSWPTSTGWRSSPAICSCLSRPSWS